MQEAIPDEEAPSAHWYSHDCTGCRFQILHGCFMSFSFLILLRDPIDRPVYLGWHQTHKVLLGGGTKHRRTRPIFAESERAPMAARASSDCVALRVPSAPHLTWRCVMKTLGFKIMCREGRSINRCRRHVGGRTRAALGRRPPACVTSSLAKQSQCSLSRCLGFAPPSCICSRH